MNKKGFTLIELMIALAVLTIISLFAGRIYLNYTASARDLKAANLVYEEGRFLMEKIIREIRQNSVDYEEYFNQNVLNGALGENYCLYDRDFYSSGLDGEIGTIDDESLGIRNAEFAHGPAIEKPIQKDLFLINLNGDRRTYVTRIEKEIDGVTVGKVAMTKLVGKDFGEDGISGTDSYNGLQAHNISCSPDARENDGLVDTWHCDPNYPCYQELLIDSTTMPGCEGYTHEILNDPMSSMHSFVDLSPNSLNVIDLKFMVHPQDDPWKAYRVNEVQIQPYITVQLTIEANPKLIGGAEGGRLPRLTLTSTVATRNYNEVKSSCI